MSCGIFCVVDFGWVYPLRPYYANTRELRQCPLLGMTKEVGEDSARNALKAIEVNAGIAWLQKHLYQS